MRRLPSVARTIMPALGLLGLLVFLANHPPGTLLKVVLLVLVLVRRAHDMMILVDTRADMLLCLRRDRVPVVLLLLCLLLPWWRLSRGRRIYRPGNRLVLQVTWTVLLGMPIVRLLLVIAPFHWHLENWRCICRGQLSRTITVVGVVIGHPSAGAVAV